MFFWSLRRYLVRWQNQLWQCMTWWEEWHVLSSQSTLVRTCMYVCMIMIWSVILFLFLRLDYPNAVFLFFNFWLHVGLESIFETVKRSFKMFISYHSILSCFSSIFLIHKNLISYIHLPLRIIPLLFFNHFSYFLSRLLEHVFFICLCLYFLIFYHLHNYFCFPRPDSWDRKFIVRCWNTRKTVSHYSIVIIWSIVTSDYVMSCPVSSHVTFCYDMSCRALSCNVKECKSHLVLLCVVSCRVISYDVVVLYNFHHVVECFCTTCIILYNCHSSWPYLHI